MSKTRERSPKPPMNGATKFIINYLLPFLNLPDEASDQDFVDSVSLVIPNLGAGHKDHVLAWATNERACGTLRETLALVKQLLRVGIGADEDPSESYRNEATSLLLMGKKKEYKKLKDGGRTTEEEVSRAMEPLFFDPHKAGRGWLLQCRPRNDRGNLTQEAWNAVWIPGGKALIVYTVLQALEGSMIYDRPLSISYYLGCCPRCGRFFEKERQDQLYDIDTCRKEFTRKK